MNLHRHLTAVSLLLAIPLGAAGCSGARDAARARITPEYDEGGKLRLLKYDSNGSGQVDTWSYMDGARVVRIEIDVNGDGKIDRWESYGPDRTLEKVEVSTHRDGTVDRREYYAQDMLVRAEQDTDGDARPDKWETYDGARLASVAFDTLHHGVPDRRLTYDPSGAAKIDVDLVGDGHLLPGAGVRYATK